MPLPFYTIGHSTRSIDELAALLHAANVERLIDIRTVPKSRTNPQFNADTLPTSLQPHGIVYERIAELGGLRSKARDIPPEVNGFWENRSFHNYADYALSDAFRTGLDLLISLGREQRCAIMCSEAVWWRCHRRIVADYLLAHGETVFHLMGDDRIEEARLTQGAIVHSPTAVQYPAA
ncbi:MULTISPECIES: DUF488 domain-containing protein [unclassified Caballeronia]|uniref:DUF488 domain-containing protein n=1 Tax=unclassified Caballeronia TaxID=2646786 RepID=UPI002859A66A|nr:MULTISPECIES: DUF488 domain-containing protein [unclassified Caballeronia]MDR5741217.1 DUF488 domain-containing protein [Caballeronia sp. LZ016]MDR5807115.1 DUF488 domain-containing protein [Caballeronia sp. LZ019]